MSRLSSRDIPPRRASELASMIGEVLVADPALWDALCVRVASRLRTAKADSFTLRAVFECPLSLRGRRDEWGFDFWVARGIVVAGRYRVGRCFAEGDRIGEFVPLGR